MARADGISDFVWHQVEHERAIVAVIAAARALVDELRLFNLSARIALPEREALRAALAALDGQKPGP